MIRESRLGLLAVVLGLTLALAACAVAPRETGEAAAGAAGDPVAGGTARILMLSDPRTLDPAALGNAYAVGAVLGNALYGTLLVDDGPSGELRNTMAESFETTDDGATFTLTLREGLVFSDGTPLDAAAVKFNWDRMKDPATRSPYLTEANMVASTTVTDARTLSVTMAAPAPNFAQSVLGSSLNWIASPAALQAGQQAFDAAPIGAGPFTLQSWQRQDKIELVKNPRYWDAPKPYLDAVTLRVSQDSGQRLNTLISGGADVVVESNWVNLDKAEQAGLPVDTLPLSGGLYLALNQRRAPFDDIRARQAVAAALDVNALNEAVYQGTSQPADTLFSEASPFHSDTVLRRSDAATAQRLFDELAAEGKPVSFTFTSFPSSENRAVAEAVQAQLSAFTNVSVEVSVVDISQAGALQISHDFDVIISSAFFADPDPRLWSVFNGNSPTNVSGVNDPALNDALQQGRLGTSVEQRKPVYDVVQQRLAELTPVIFLARAAPSAISGKNVGGLVQYGSGSLLPEEIWIKP